MWSVILRRSLRSVHPRSPCNALAGSAGSSCESDCEGSRGSHRGLSTDSRSSFSWCSLLTLLLYFRSWRNANLQNWGWNEGFPGNEKSCVLARFVIHSVHSLGLGEHSLHPFLPSEFLGILGNMRVSSSRPKLGDLPFIFIRLSRVLLRKHPEVYRFGDDFGEKRLKNGQNDSVFLAK